MTSFAYTGKALELQKRFDTDALAAAELQVIVHSILSPADRAFIGGWRCSGWHRWIRRAPHGQLQGWGEGIRQDA